MSYAPGPVQPVEYHVSAYALRSSLETNTSFFVSVDISLCICCGQDECYCTEEGTELAVRKKHG